MKKRTGFVSNSSSSSFICVVCEKDGYGMYPEDAGMLCCKHGHEFCVECAVNVNSPSTATVFDSEKREDKRVKLSCLNDFLEVGVGYCVPDVYCPACQGKLKEPDVEEIDIKALVEENRRLREENAGLRAALLSV